MMLLTAKGLAIKGFIVAQHTSIPGTSENAEKLVYSELGSVLFGEARRSREQESC